MRAQRVFAIAAFLCTFTMVGGLLFAHHSVVGYDTKQTITLKGVVSEWRWRNPHAFIVFDVKDASGNVVQWSGELQSPISMAAAGLTRESFKAGDEVSVTLHPSTKGAPAGVVKMIKNGDGKVILDRSNPLEP